MKFGFSDLRMTDIIHWAHVSFFFMFTVSWVFVPSSTRLCNDIPPGLEMLRWGVDASELNFFPSSNEHEKRFLRRPVFDEFTCAKRKTWTDKANEEKYELPDEIDSLLDRRMGHMKYSTVEYVSNEDVMKARKYHMDVTTVFELGMFSLGLSYDELFKHFLNVANNVTDVTVEYMMYTVTLKHHKLLRTKKDIEKIVGELEPKFENDPDKYENFVKQFGTHFIEKATFGGQVRLRFFEADKKSSKSSKTDKLMESKITAVFAALIAIINFSGEMHDGNLKILESRASATFCDYFGGQMNICDMKTKNTSKAIEEWKRGLHLEPWFIGAEIAPLSDLIQDSEKRESMERAREVYLLKLHLEQELQPLLYQSLGARRLNQDVTDEPIKALKLKLKQLMDEKIPDLNNVKELEDEIQFEVLALSWWKQVEFCFKYYANEASGSFQCKPDTHGYEQTFCAAVNELTESYRDTTRGNAKGACLMSWSIQAPSVISYRDFWFESTQICFRYKSEVKYSNGQCNGSKDKGYGSFCANFNTFTKYYADNTDDRPGGCYES